MLTYDLDRDIVLLRSPVTGQLHAFDAEHLVGFLQWLKSREYTTTKFGDLQVEHRPAERKLAVTFPVRPALRMDMVVFDEGRFDDEVHHLEAAALDLLRRVRDPAQEMKDQGLAVEHIVMEVDRRQLFSLPTLWERDDE